MLLDGVELLGSSIAVNLSLASGSTLPASGNNLGELFYKTGDDAGLYVYTGSAWVITSAGGGGVTAGVGINVQGTTVSAPYYDIALTSAGSPLSFERVLQFAAVRAYTIPANFTGCVGKVRLVPASTAVFSIRKNDSEFGTLTFATGQQTGTFSASSLTSFAVGDLLQIVAPETPDTTLADIGISFAATLV